MKIVFLILFFYNLVFSAADVYTKTTSGFLYNMPIENLYYETDNCIGSNGASGHTDEYGGFILDTKCSDYIFYINNLKRIKLLSIKTSDIQKTASLHNGKNILFLTNFVGVDSNATSNTDALSLAQLFMSLDDDSNPTNGIKLENDKIEKNYNFLDHISEYSQNDLNDILQKQFPDRNLTNKQCAQAFFEYVLRTNPFKTFDINTAGPCDPALAYEQKATASDKTYIEIYGDVGSELVLDGNATGKILYSRGDGYYPTGVYEEFELNTSIEYNSFDRFNITLKNKNGTSTTPLELSIFNDTDQPYFGRDYENNKTTSDLEIFTLNIEDSSKDNGLSLTFDTNDSRFTIDPITEIITRDEAMTSGTYKFKVYVQDEAWHREEAEFTLTIP